MHATLIVDNYRLQVHSLAAMDKVLAKITCGKHGFCTRAALVHSPLDTLEFAYEALQKATGIDTKRAGKAVALIRALGLTNHARRFNKLTTRRKFAAHLDAPFLVAFRAALGQLDSVVISEVSRNFESDNDLPPDEIAATSDEDIRPQYKEAAVEEAAFQKEDEEGKEEEPCALKEEEKEVCIRILNFVFTSMNSVSKMVILHYN